MVDFEVKLVSEADPGSNGVEYELDAPNKALFFINGKRIVASPWDQGYNIVVLDPVSRLPLSQKVKEMSCNNTRHFGTNRICLTLGYNLFLMNTMLIEPG